jgi:hypothetical protein
MGCCMAYPLNVRLDADMVQRRHCYKTVAQPLYFSAVSLNPVFECPQAGLGVALSIAYDQPCGPLSASGICSSETCCTLRMSAKNLVALRCTVCACCGSDRNFGYLVKFRMMMVRVHLWTGNVWLAHADYVRREQCPVFFVGNSLNRHFLCSRCSMRLSSQ